ncbi:MAG: PQQ-binding-like beta-propeller repeat protein [bacterium]|nr:PQQ-binding-like beta-propeller repeat protein [bacterium]
MKRGKEIKNKFIIFLVIYLGIISIANAKENYLYNSKYRYFKTSLKYEGNSLSSPNVADIDGDNKIDLILIATLDGNIYAWDNKGELYENYPVAIADEIRGKVHVIDINNDRQKELVVATLSGYIIALSISGEKLWTKYVGGRIIKGITVNDIDSDGKVEILVPIASNRKGCLAIDAATGEEKWFFSSSGQAVPPKVGDINGDGKNEIICIDGKELYCINIQGKLLWKRSIGSDLNNTFWSCEPTLYDIDNDDKQEVIIVENNRLIILNGKGREILNVSYGSSRYNRSINSPLVVDINRDGINDVVWVDGSNNIYAVSLNKRIVPGFPIYGISVYGDHFHATPIVLDLIKDDNMEIILTSMGGYIYFATYNRERKSFEIIDSIRLPYFDSFKNNAMSVNSLAYDLDKDGDYEVLINHKGGVMVWDFPKKKSYGIFIEERKDIFKQGK